MQESLFKQWWEARRHVIEPCAAVVAIGALMLGIPCPQDPKAVIILEAIKLFWLILIFIVVIVIALNFYLYISVVEKTTWLYRTFTDFLVGIILVFSTLVALYIYYAYKSLIIRFFESSHYFYLNLLWAAPLSAVTSSFAVAVQRKIRGRKGWVVFWLMSIASIGLVILPVWLFRH